MEADISVLRRVDLTSGCPDGALRSHTGYASNSYYFECVIYDYKSMFMFIYLIYFTVRCTYTMIDAEIK